MGFFKGACKLAEFVSPGGERGRDGVGWVLVALEVGKPASEDRQWADDAIGENEDEAAKGSGKEQGWDQDPSTQPG